jgi:hypothetical protein
MVEADEDELDAGVTVANVQTLAHPDRASPPARPVRHPSSSTRPLHRDAVSYERISG